MGTGLSEVNLSTDKEMEDADTTVEIKIKTLDSQTYTLRVNKFVPVTALKDQIATVTGVISEQQRLICRGKVLKDDELLSAYHVEDGHTLHLVVRQPMQTSSSPSTSVVDFESAASQPAANFASNTEQSRGNPSTHSIVFEAVNIGQGAQGLGQLLSGLFGNAGRGSVRSGNTSHQNSAHPHQTATSSSFGFDPLQNASQIPAIVHSGPQQPLVIPDSLTTMNEYINILRDEFQREGFGPIDGQSNDLHSRSVFGQGSLPSPASLAEIVRATRDLLIRQADGCLSQLARYLDDQMNVTDPSTRMNIQSTAIRTGVMLQNLGPLLLELGRTTMTLRMGQTTSEAVVNAGPAVFISSSGPNPLMVQGVPYPFSNSGRINMRTVNSGPVLEGVQPPGSSYPPHSIDVQIHSGQSVPVASANSSEQVNAQQEQEHTDAARGHILENIVRQVFAGIGGTTSTGDSGVRVVPIRTVVAVPAGVAQSPSDASGSGVGILYPLLARLQRMNSSSGNDGHSSQESNGLHPAGSDINQGPTVQTPAQRQNLESVNVDAGRDGNHFPPDTSTAGRDGSHIPPDTAPATSGMNPANGSSWSQETTRVYISSRQILGNNDSGSSQTHLERPHIEGSLVDMLRSSNPLFRNMTGQEINMSSIGHHNSMTGIVSDQVAANRDADVHDASLAGNDQVTDQAVFFSNMLRQAMPYISQDRDSQPSTSTATSSQEETENQAGSRRSRPQPDPPGDPDPKRQKID